ncbi:MAG: V/A-type H+/Na+-transporting ATPase subunit [Bacteroidales bacterium]|nr:V/A-type H+/Na+-transporting ATPase subunit [Bacteroidales bacterium]
MIVPMHKYTFLVFHADYHPFLKGLREVGVVDVVKRTKALSEEAAERLLLQRQVTEVIKQLRRRKREPSADKPPFESGADVLDRFRDLQAEIESLNQQLNSLNKEIAVTEPWGDYDPAILHNLRKAGLHIHFYTVPPRRFNPDWANQYKIGVVNETPGLIYFILVTEPGEELPEISAEWVKGPEKPLSQLYQRREELNARLDAINSELDTMAATCIPLLEDFARRLSSEMEYEIVVSNTLSEADDKLKILEGFAPVEAANEVEKFCNDHEIFFLRTDPSPEERVPILLRNGNFARLFEPISRLFSLPKYTELDLTPFFAPFFMMFFGFCLGDAGYGLVVLLGATLYKKFKASPSLKPYLSLAQWLGLATVIFGIVSGTFFGINLIEANISWLENVKKYFLDSNKMLVLALILGGVQIVFGMMVKVLNITRQQGFKYALSTIGWLIVILGMVVRYFLISAQILPADDQWLMYGVLGAGGILIFLLNDPDANVFVRVGKGIWDVYGVVTGIFGDLLSYIRLFALGISSAILGLVINSVGMSMLDIPYVGPVVFVIFLTIGHVANIAISSLGSFVHPMRLTFVEFYKNAGFTGGGKEYQPFSGQNLAKN